MSHFKVLPNQYTGGGKTQTKKWKPVCITEMTVPFQTKHQNRKQKTSHKNVIFEALKYVHLLTI